MIIKTKTKKEAETLLKNIQIAHYEKFVDVKIDIRSFI